MDGAIAAVSNDVGARALSTLTIRRTGAFLSAEVTGVDLRKPLNAATVEAIGNALAQHEVLVFPDQEISAEDLMRFGRYFGLLSVHPFSTNADHAPELIVFDNKEGNPPHATDIWHSDETFREIPPMATALCSKVIPEIGGDTCFCSMTAAYDGLSDRMQNFLSGLEAVHEAATIFREPVSSGDASGGAGASRDRAQSDLRQSAVHAVHQGHGRTGKPDAAGDSVRFGESAGTSVPPPVVTEPACVLGQSLGAACGGARLLSAAAAHGSGDDRGRCSADR